MQLQCIKNNHVHYTSCWIGQIRHTLASWLAILLMHRIVDGMHGAYSMSYKASTCAPYMITQTDLPTLTHCVWVSRICVLFPPRIAILTHKIRRKVRIFSCITAYLPYMLRKLLISRIILLIHTLIVTISRVWAKICWQVCTDQYSHNILITRHNMINIFIQCAVCPIHYILHVNKRVNQLARLCLMLTICHDVEWAWLCLIIVLSHDRWLKIAKIKILGEIYTNLGFDL